MSRNPFVHLTYFGILHLAPDTFGFHSPSQLVIGYHRLRFLNQVPQFTTNVEYEIETKKKLTKTKRKLTN